MPGEALLAAGQRSQVLVNPRRACGKRKEPLYPIQMNWVAMRRLEEP